MLFYLCTKAPLLLDALAFHVLMTEGDIHRVKEPLFLSEVSYSFQLVTLYFFLNFGLRLRLRNSFIPSCMILRIKRVKLFIDKVLQDFEIKGQSN